MDMASTGLLIVWFLVIVALIPVSLWLLKRSGLAQGAMGGAAAPVRTVGNVNLGPGQRIVTVEVGEGESRTWLVLGVTSQQINTLHSMAPMSAPVVAGEAAGLPPQFASLLRSKLGKRQEPQ